MSRNDQTIGSILRQQNEEKSALIEYSEDIYSIENAKGKTRASYSVWTVFFNFKNELLGALLEARIKLLDEAIGIGRFFKLSFCIG